MNAVVDDLTNYLGPDPNATGDGGVTKVYQATAGQTWTLKPTLLMDMTFGFGRQNQTVLGPDFNAGNYGLDVLGIPGTNDQGIGDQRYAGYPQFNMGFCGGRQPRRLEPDLPRRAHLFARHERHQGRRPPRHPRRLLPELPLSRSLAAGNRQPARAFHLQRRTRPGCAAARRPTSTTSTRRSCSAWSATPTRACRTS